ncbi:hypothetical protein [Micromonospora sp. DT47]|uniref:hypothetical protein n=1 Tax=Micromonospora sp. DT47 TaxID=3393431 RepID=UPI003CF8696D
MHDLETWVRAAGGARVEFMPGEEDDPATVENIDARIYGSDGTCYYATFLTTNEIARILTRWLGSGEVGGGRYFWCSDLVIVPGPGLQTMAAAVDEMIRSGDIDAVLSKVGNEGERPSE